MKKLKKVVVFGLSLAVVCGSLSSSELSAQENRRIAVIPCDGTIIGSPVIEEERTEVVEYLTSMKMKMPYEFTFEKTDSYSLSAEVVRGYELGFDEILKIGNQFSLNGEVSIEYSQSHKITFDEPGYRYVRPAVFAKYVTVKVPVNEEIEPGVCVRDPEWSYIDYPEELLLDGEYSN